MARLLRIYPGETDFKEVNEKEFKHDFHPHEVEKMVDVSEYGLVSFLESEIAVYERPGGKLLEARRWPSRSYVRNFSKLLKMLVSFSAESLTDVNSSLFTPIWVTTSGNTNVGPMASPSITEATGAMLGIGQGVTSEDAGRTNLFVPVALQIARTALYTTTEDTVKIEFSINEGITIAASAGINVSEIGLFSWFNNTGATASSTTSQQAAMLAYDQVTVVPVSQGGVVAPKYTMSFVA